MESVPWRATCLVRGTSAAPSNRINGDLFSERTAIDLIDDPSPRRDHRPELGYLAAREDFFDRLEIVEQGRGVPGRIGAALGGLDAQQLPPWQLVGSISSVASM